MLMLSMKELLVTTVVLFLQGTLFAVKICIEICIKLPILSCSCAF